MLFGSEYPHEPYIELTAVSSSIPNFTVAVPPAVPVYVWSETVICVALFLVNARFPFGSGLIPVTPERLIVPELGKLVAFTLVITN